MRACVSLFGIVLAAVLLLPAVAASAENGEAHLAVSVKDARGEPCAARVSLHSEKGELVASAYFRGSAMRRLDPGKYRLVVSRGPTHTAFDEVLELKAGTETARTVVLNRVVDTSDLLGVDPLCQVLETEGIALAREAEDIDRLVSPEALGVAVARFPRRVNGRFSGTQLCPFTGIAERPEILQGLAAFVVGEGDDAGAWWAPLGAPAALRLDWFHLLSRGHRIGLLAGSGSSPIPGMPRVYVPKPPEHVPFATDQHLLPAARSGAAIVSWGILVELWGEGMRPGPLVQSRFGGIELRVKVQAAPWVETHELTVFSGGKPVVHTDLRPAQGILRLDKTYRMRSSRDTYYVVAASAKESLAAYKPLNVRPLGIAGPVWVDADGDGRYTPAHAYASQILRRYEGFAAAALEALASEPIGIRVQGAGIARDPVLLDHMADDLSLPIRLAVLGNLRRTRPAWAPDILARRLVKCDRQILELAGVVAALGVCGKPTGLDRFAERFREASLGACEIAHAFLVSQGNPIWPRRWHVVGPFADPERAGIRGLYGPERGVVPGQRFADRHGGVPAWSEVEPTRGVLRFEEKPEPAVYFALARLTARQGARLGLLLSNRDGISAWIDGEKILEESGREARSVFRSQYLAPGGHTILLKISRRRGAAAVGFHVLDPGRAITFEAG